MVRVHFGPLKTGIDEASGLFFTWANANDDGIVDVSDLLIMVSNWGLAIN